MSLTEQVCQAEANRFEVRLGRPFMNARIQSILRACLLALLMVVAPLSGCMGENDVASSVDIEAALTIDGEAPQDAEIRAGEWHDVLLMGEDLRLSAPAHDVWLFVDGVLDIDSSVPVDGDRVLVQLLTTPYTEHVELVVWAKDGTKSVLNRSVSNGTPILTGEAWYEKMDYITCDTPSDDCGAYNGRWMGSPNPQFERAASYFQGHFEGLGYETHLMRVVDHLNPSQPESLNVIAWKRGTSDDCVQGMGSHMDIAPPGGPPGGGTAEGAYDNTAGTVVMMLYAQALVDIEVECDTFLGLWSSEEEGLWGSRSFANDLPDGVTVSNYLNLDMAGVNYPGDYALSVYLGPDGTEEAIDQAGMFHLAEWIGADALDLGYEMERGREAWLAGGESPLWGDIYEDTVAIYESPTARSDHDSFQNIGVATLGWNGLVDGYPCYHRECDTMETMIEYMDTDNSTGINNLVHSWDIVTWWAVYAFLHMDQTPVPNEL